jgi:Lipocalin-like domain
MALCGVSLAQSQERKDAASASDKEKLIGAWHLVSVGEPGADGQSNHGAEIKGILIYTRDGHMSVQLMYPPSAASLSNDYLLNGYEASFGSYDVDEAAHMVTHHVQGSIHGDLSGRTCRAFTNSPRTGTWSSSQLIQPNTDPLSGSIIERFRETHNDMVRRRAAQDR